MLEHVENWWMRYVLAYPFWDTFWSLLLPVFLISVLLGEGILYYSGRRQTRHELIFLGCVIAGCVVVWYLTQPATNPRSARPGAYLLFVVWAVVGPALLLTIASHVLAKSRFQLVKHGGVAFLAVLLALAWPLFALSSLCASGLDCI